MGWQWCVLFFTLALYLVLFAVYYPPLCGIEDEVGFVNQAVVWSKGAVSAEGAGFQSLPDFVPAKGRTISWRNPGRSLIVLPFVAAFGLRSIFISGALIHVAIALTAALIHFTLGQSPLWAILVLCHPTLSIYSRTIMGDAPASLFLLLAVLVVLSRPKPGYIAGLLIGLAVLMRYHSGVVVPFFAAALWRDSLVVRRRLEALKCLIVSSIVIVIIAAYNTYLTGSPVGSPAGYFAGSFFGPNFVFYGGALLLLWPGMLMAPLVEKSRLGSLALATCVPVLLLFSFYYFHDTGSSLPETLVLGQRLLQCILPIWIVTYASTLHRLSLRLIEQRWQLLKPAVIAAAFVVLLTTQWYLFRRHQEYLLGLKAVRDELAATVPAGAVIVSNTMILKLFGIPYPALPRYRWIPIDEAASYATGLRTELRPWFFGVLPKHPDDEVLRNLPEFVHRYGLVPVRTATPKLLLYAALPQSVSR